ncbi:DegT/DnrJ/EryC1/StrS family aminotransferase, partial [Alphaproteobacteria bacterium]|nr:DegT/DnrJ/EryC1/StrS family aminotransferase [Alphaproteobacteria bacterium]
MPILDKAIFNLEKKILSKSNKKYCLLTGNGTTGIYLAIKCLGLLKPRVLMPNSVCHNVHLAILLAGGIPVFIDIDKNNLGIEIDDLKNYKNINIIIAPHSYGNPCNIFKIKKYCNSNKIILIEDCAMVSNAKLKNKYYGNFGDFSIQSFGKDKILDLEYGGAVLNNNFELHKKMKSIISKINKINKKQLQEIKKINKNFKYIYNSFFLT